MTIRSRQTDLSPDPTQRTARADPILKMIKTFSLSALFFMTVGMLCATHMTLPF